VVLRVAVRYLIAFAWGVLALWSPWSGLGIVFGILAVLSLAHAVIAIANRIKNKGVLLRIMGSGSIEWPQSYQEKWLQRPLDWVDGTRVEVLTDEPIAFPAPAAPHVSLRGDTHGIAHVPLFRRSPETFMEMVNELVSARGVTFVEVGRGSKPRASEADEFKAYKLEPEAKPDPQAKSGPQT